VEYVSSYLTLEKDDIIATGTPSGVGPVLPGDIIEASIEKIGTITHKVVLEDI
jgi:2-keto-4-pentenoate hydratase/2-oxohepta-3-ene-1,7-dioic acid hydratase in catechol pathway